MRMEARHLRGRERQRDKNGCRVTMTVNQGLRAKDREKQAKEGVRKEREGDKGKKDEGERAEQMRRGGAERKTE